MEELLDDPAAAECDDVLSDSLVWLDEALKAGRSVSIDDLPFTLSDTQRDTWVAAKQCLEQMREFSPAKPTSQQLSAVPERVGRFVIECVIGVGGHGIVYRARDPHLGRIVALKVPRPHTLLSADLRERFLREARAASQLDHPHIIAIHEAGNDGELPYIAYAYCEGPTLAGWLQQHPGPMSPGTAAEVLEALTSAVAYSHDRGIIHRDIKPGNVLLMPQAQGTSSSFPFVPRLSDYGLAKLTEANLADTRSSQVLGTPLYMAPEQLQRNTRAEAGPSVDVYALGTVLYTLLTGRPPFVADTSWDVLLQIREREPTAPSVVQPRVPRDLETICLKCLEKNPRQRYASAAALLEDLRRFRKGLPIQAVPIGPLERGRRWCVRHPGISLLSGSVVVLMLGLFVGLLMHLATLSQHRGEIAAKNITLANQVVELETAVQTADRAQQEAEASADQARLAAYASDMERAADCWERKDLRDLTRILEPYERNPLLQPYREFSWWYLKAQTQADGQRLSTGRQACWTVRFSPAGQELVSAGSASVVQVFSHPAGALLREWLTDQQEVNSLAFSPDGQQLATAGDDGTIKLWDFPTGQLTRSWTVAADCKMFGVQFAPDGQSLVACGNGPDVVLIDIATGESQSIATSAQTLEALAISPDGRTLALASDPKSVLLFDLTTRMVRTELPLTEKRPSSVAYSPDGRWLAGASNSGELQVWDAAAETVVATIKRPDAIRAVAFRADGRLACGDGGGVISWWKFTPPAAGESAGTLQPERIWQGHNSSAQTLMFAPDGQSLVSGTRGQEVALWKTTPRVAYHQLAAPNRNPGFSTPKILAQGTDDQVWHAELHVLDEWTLGSQERRRTAQFERELNSVAIREATIAFGTDDGHVGVCSVADLENVRWWPLFGGVGIDSVALLADGQRGLACSFRNGWVLFDCVTGKSLHRVDKVQRFAVSPDDSAILILPVDTNDLLVLNGSTLTEEHRLRGHSGSVLELAFSPDGSLAVSVDVERTALVWDRATWTILHTLTGFTDIPNAIAFSPNGRTLAIGQEHGQVRLWHVATGRPLVDLPLPDGFFVDVVFTRDGRHLVATSKDRALISYDAVPSSTKE